MIRAFEGLIFVLHLREEDRVLNRHRSLNRGSAQQEGVATADLIWPVRVEDKGADGLVRQQQGYSDGGAVANLHRHERPGFLSFLVNGGDIFAVSDFLP